MGTGADRYRLLTFIPKEDSCEWHFISLLKDPIKSSIGHLYLWPTRFHTGLLSFLISLHWSSHATMIKYHRLGGLNDRNLFSHRSGCCKSKTRAPVWLVLVKAPFLACRWPSTLRWQLSLSLSLPTSPASPSLLPSLFKRTQCVRCGPCPYNFI